VFELDPVTATWQDVERRYKELVKKYHPDRYASQGLPKEMLDAAAHRFGIIVDAFESLKKRYGQ
jgi:DnaJ-domain-containing protein 1